MPLLEYASCYWGDHARKEMTEKMAILALRLLDGFDKHISAQLMLLHWQKDCGSGPYFSLEEGPTGFTGLHAVAFFGITGIVATVLEMHEWNADATDISGSTALTWAANRGHEAVVKILWERTDVSPHQADAEYGRTPLLWAAGIGHEGIVMMLLERADMSPNQADA